jgi:HEXXH motif-containing protein
MTSSSGVDAVLRELRFRAAPDAGLAGFDPTAEGGDARFRFATDFDAPESWPDVTYDTALPVARHDAAARARIHAVLDEAAHAMARRTPRALRRVDDQLQRVLLRCSESAPGGSASHRAHVGACLLTNLHQPADAALVAIEAVTHESIHQLLYRTEQANGLWCDLAPTPTFRSPWSGARLPLHSLVHASFVWFGLLTLWTEMAQQPASAAEAAHARGRMAHCLFGFAFLDDLLDSSGFPVASVDPQVLEGMRAMAAATRRATQAAERQAALRQVIAAREGLDWPAAIATGLA